MQKLSFKVRLFLKTIRAKSNGEYPICVRVRLGTSKMEFNTDMYSNTVHWDDKKEEVRPEHPQSKQTNAHLLKIKSKLSEAHTQLFITGNEITLEAIKDLYIGKKTQKEIGLIEITETHNKQFSSLVGIRYSSGSYKNYKTSLKYIKEYLKNINKADLPITKINYHFLESFYNFLLTKKNCGINGANKHIQRLKKITNYAVKLGHIIPGNINSFKTTNEPFHRIALTTEEVAKLNSLELSRKTLILVRDVFLFQCYTGLSYSDIKRLCLANIYKGIDDTWIKMSRQKTNISFSIPLLPIALQIIGRYADETKPHDPIFQVLSNQKMNENLKIIQELAGLKKNLTTHLARHSFATIALNHGVSIESVSTMLGHSSIRMTQLYAKVLDHKVAEDMKRLKDKLT